MSYKIGGGFSDTQDNLKNFSQKGSSNDSGPYVAVVKNTIDPLRMGRLGVVIPELSRTDGHDINASQIIWCQYLSPFYGAKPFKSNTKDSAEGPQQRSYGMWSIPPDIDTNVLVIFAKGEKGQKNAFWLGCIQEPLTNQMVPGHGASENTINNSNKFTQQERMRGGGSNFKNYGTNYLPVQEKNKKSYGEGETNLTMNDWEYPVHTELADQLESQGLIDDTIRGTTSSSARRETPSQVFGWNTPGPISEKSRELNIGVNQTPLQVDRDIGHSFVMDDGDEAGENRLTRIRTASGHQLLMHDTEGVVYIANGSGKAFIEMDSFGTVSIYAQDGINLRTEGDFNLHSDRNIQFHAKEKIKFTAEEDVVLNAEKYIYAMGQSGILNASHKGSVRHYAKDGITSFTDGPQLHGAKGRIDLAGSQVHFNSVPARETWGPSWMKPDHDKIQIIAKDGEIDIEANEPIIEGQVQTLYNRTTVRNTSIGRGKFSGETANVDPRYLQPNLSRNTNDNYGSIQNSDIKGTQFDNSWEELEALIGPNGDGKNSKGEIIQSNLGFRKQQLIKELGVVTPFMDKQNGVGNMKEKKAEYFKAVKQRQKSATPDGTGYAFVTHEPWSRGARPNKFNGHHQYDPFYKGRFLNEWEELESLLNVDGGTQESYDRRNELLEKFGVETYAKDGEFGGNLGEAKDKFYKDLKLRQDNYASLSASEQSKIIEENN